MGPRALPCTIAHPVTEKSKIPKEAQCARPGPDAKNPEHQQVRLFPLAPNYYGLANQSQRSFKLKGVKTWVASGTPSPNGETPDTTGVLSVTASGLGLRQGVCPD